MKDAQFVPTTNFPTDISTASSFIWKDVHCAAFVTGFPQKSRAPSAAGGGSFNNIQRAQVPETKIINTSDGPVLRTPGNGYGYEKG